MKATLHFNLEDQDEKYQFKRFIMSNNALPLLEDIRDMLRKYRKYEDLTEEQGRFLMKIEENIFELAEQHEINLWDL